MTATAMETSTDRIEKRVVIRAPRSRVWRAIANAQEFGTWFRVQFDGAFAEGVTLQGKLNIPGFEGMLEVSVERMQPESFFSYRWHPYAIDPKVDYTKEPTTLVEFRLDESGNETVLTLVESGFDRLPASRRVEAFRMNDGGWTSQLKRVEQYVANG
jgi:uncharacterized protein YndB with AHSA1/START domain